MFVVEFDFLAGKIVRGQVFSVEIDVIAGGKFDITPVTVLKNLDSALAELEVVFDFS